MHKKPVKHVKYRDMGQISETYMYGFGSNNRFLKKNSKTYGFVSNYRILKKSVKHVMWIWVKIIKLYRILKKPVNT